MLVEEGSVKLDSIELIDTVRDRADSLTPTLARPAISLHKVRATMVSVRTALSQVSSFTYKA